MPTSVGFSYAAQKLLDVPEQHVRGETRRATADGLPEVTSCCRANHLLFDFAAMVDVMKLPLGRLLSDDLLRVPCGAPLPVGCRSGWPSLEA